ncbi:MAG: ADP-ribosylation factor-like protein [Candidatus Thorarchaeota archaeon]
MIHNTFLVRESTGEILVSSQYWPIEVTSVEMKEFVSTRSEIKTASGTDFSELPLIIQDNKMMAAECIKDVLLVFVTDVGEDEKSISDKTKDAAKTLRKAVAQNGLEYLITNYETIIEPSIVSKLKIALVGEGGTGKTTTLHLLLGDTPPLQYVPTIALNLETVENIRFGSYSLVLWDFAGQERFRKLWRFYFHGADVIFLVCDSTLRNVIISKDIFKLIKRDAPKVPVFALANKQDKPNAMKPEVIQKILGIPTYPMVAIDKNRRDEMLRILMTAAAQYVGIALPDLPASELLRFTDTATEAAVATDALYADEPEVEDEEYEEVYVDEDGQIIEDIGEYEIVDEIVEEVVEVDEAEPEVEISESVEELGIEISDELSEAIEAEPPIEVGEIEVVSPDSDQPVITEETMDEIFSHQRILQDAVDAFDHAVPESKPEVTPTTEDIAIEAPIEFEIISTESSTVEDVTPELEVEFVTEEDVVPVEESDTASPSEAEVAVEDGFAIAKDLISDALEADDMITAEIDRITGDELDSALEAFSSDEAVAIDEAEETPAEVIEETTKKEIDEILGALDSYDDAAEDEEEDDDDLFDFMIEDLDEVLSKLKGTRDSFTASDDTD